jgi:Mg2+-importing ATPase
VSLIVLQDGVTEGRRIFGNILKYIRMGASSNFGNMFSVIGGSTSCRSCRWPRYRF